MRVAGRVILCHSVAVAAHPKRLTAERIRSALFETGVHVRNSIMAPNTCVGLCLAGFKLIVSVKGPVVLLFVAAETELKGVGYTSSTQQIAIGHSIRLSSLAAHGYIMTTETGKHSILKGEIGGDFLRDSGAWRQIHRVDLASGEPPIMTRLTQLRHITIKSQSAPAGDGGSMAGGAQRRVSVGILSWFLLIHNIFSSS